MFWICTPAAAEGPPVEPPVEAPDEVPVDPAPPITYRLRPTKGWLYVLVRNDESRWTPVVGHDHAIVATGWTGRVVWDADDAGACDVQITVPIDGLVVDPPGAREHAGLDPEGAIKDGTKQTVLKNMRGNKNLSSPPNVEVTFQSTSCDGTSGLVGVTGDLQIAGVTRSVQASMQVEATPDGFSASGRLPFTHTLFGMSPFTYGLATPKNLDALELVIQVVGAPVADAPP